MKNMRKTRFFQSDAYIAVDFLDKTAEILRLKNITDEQNVDPMAMVIDLGSNKGKKQIIFDKPDVGPINAIKTELESLATAIENNTNPLVSINDGYAALDIAYKIIGKMNFS